MAAYFQCHLDPRRNGPLRRLVAAGLGKSWPIHRSAYAQQWIEVLTVGVGGMGYLHCRSDSRQDRILQRLGCYQSRKTVNGSD